MNILFLTMSSQLRNIETSGIYTDLMRKFRDSGHTVYIIAPHERRSKRGTEYTVTNGVHFLGVATLNLSKTNVIEKGVGQLLLEYQFSSALHRYWSDVSFDVILYSTPPITFTRVIKDVKRHNPKAISYLLLKDIFPQNAVDLGMLTTSGVKGMLYRYFRHKERRLYAISDYIGCMSPANVRYLLEHNPEIEPSKVEVAPNSYDIPTQRADDIEPHQIRARYGLPTNIPIFIYGGNMGKPQGIPFILECLDRVKHRTDCHFLLVGNGTEYATLEAWMKRNRPTAVSLFENLPKRDYDALASSCDVGLIFLDYRFTIPNYPSRLLPYIMSRKPIIAATDPNCDMGALAEANGYGYWSPSNSADRFVEVVEKMLHSDIRQMGDKGYEFFMNNYTTEHTYNTIIKHCKE